mmetsp:Transcript_27862/g.34397  ORF Transcript_27862/g.34397 Transcript_27862/m.34397 type:complete len:736 (+) Transcript_27862:127-2334(+)
MPKQSKPSKKKTKSQQGGEIQESKSPAEFFAENQAIAGFDNHGRSLYTTIRELVENALDACESVNILPEIEIKIEDMSQDQFNELRGVGGNTTNIDLGLFQKSGASAGTSASASSTIGVKGNDSNDTTIQNDNDVAKSTSTNKNKNDGDGKSGKVLVPPSETKKKKKKGGGRSEETYFRITVRDNGCGMDHDDIPNLLGRVLSGSKYGVRQTRGKFGLGSKMALIWSKKSTGMPIKIISAHMKKDKQAPFISTCVLDIDIYKNEPRIIQHAKVPNEQKWAGTLMEVVIAGNWTTYKSRIVQYLQQLAIITPYAKFDMHYTNLKDEKKEMKIRYDRRSEQMPAPAKEVKHHPSSVNNLLIQQLLDKSQSKTLLKFFCDDLSGVSPSIAKRVIAELGKEFSEDMKPSSLNGNQITYLVQLLRKVELFKTPDGSCLSPLGEYNLNLGIRKVIEPVIVATARDKANAYEGHPFIVEAAISLGGKLAKEGLNVVRFANRIPLLFEAGSDVVTRVAQNKIKWSSYKIDHKKDKIGIFVSIVSTKIPFKGTGKEYIGDDITEIQQSVKRAIQTCCQQLRSHLTKRNALRDANQKRSRLTKYIPDVTRSLYGILDKMKKRKSGKIDMDHHSSPRKLARKSLIVEESERDKDRILEQMDKNLLNEERMKTCLIEAVDLQAAVLDNADDYFGSNGKGSDGVNVDSQPLYLVPFSETDDSLMDIQHSLFTFRPMNPVKYMKSISNC